MKMIRRVKNYILRCQFIFDSPLAIFVAFLTNPFFFVRRNLFKNITCFAPQMTDKVLDFGCGSKPYEQYFTNVSEYIGCDIAISGHEHTNEKIDVYYDGRNLPFENETFDNIFTSEVFEHIFNLEPIIKELHRVLKQGGVFWLPAHSFGTSMKCRMILRGTRVLAYGTC